MIKEKFISLSSREKLLTAIAGLALALFAIYSGLIEPLHKSYAARTETLAMLELEKSNLVMQKQLEKENRQKIETALKNKESLRSRLTQAKENILDGARLNDILKILSDPGAGHDIILVGLHIDSKPVTKSPDGAKNREALNRSRFTPARNRETPPATAKTVVYTRNQITIKVKSGFGSLAYLFQGLFDGPMPLFISKLSVIRDSSPGASGVAAQIDLIVYTSPL